MEHSNLSYIGVILKNPGRTVWNGLRSKPDAVMASLVVEMASTLLPGLTWNSLCSLGWLWTHGSLSTSSSWMPGLQMWAIMPGHCCLSTKAFHSKSHWRKCHPWLSFSSLSAVYLEMLCLLWQHLQLQSLPTAGSSPTDPGLACVSGKDGLWIPDSWVSQGFLKVVGLPWPIIKSTLTKS